MEGGTCAPGGGTAGRGAGCDGVCWLRELRDGVPILEVHPKRQCGSAGASEAKYVLDPQRVGESTFKIDHERAETWVKNEWTDQELSKFGHCDGSQNSKNRSRTFSRGKVLGMRRGETTSFFDTGTDAHVIPPHVWTHRWC